MHRLVHAAARSYVRRSNRVTDIRTLALEHLDSIFPARAARKQDDGAFRAFWGSHTAHARRLLEDDSVMECVKLDSRQKFSLYKKFGIQYHNREWLIRAYEWCRLNLHENDPEYVDTQCWLAMISGRRIDRTGKAIELLESVVQKEDALPGLNTNLSNRISKKDKLASMYDSEGMTSKVVEILESTAAIRSETVMYQQSLGSAYYKDWQAHKAIEMFKSAITIEPDHHSFLLRRIFLRRQLGLAYYRSEQAHKALDVFETLDSRPMNLESSSSTKLDWERIVGEAYCKIGRADKAIKMFDDALTAYGETSREGPRDNYSLLGLSLRLGQAYYLDGQVSKSIDLLRRLEREQKERIGKRPIAYTLEPTQYHLSIAYYVAGQKDDAVMLLRKLFYDGNEAVYDLDSEYLGVWTEEAQDLACYDHVMEKTIELLGHVDASLATQFSSEDPCRILSQRALAIFREQAKRIQAHKLSPGS